MRLLLILFVCVFAFLSCNRQETSFRLLSPDSVCTIVVDYGAYADAVEAAAARRTVNWPDSSDRNNEAYRTAFAALELQHHLCRLLHLPPERLPIEKEENAPVKGNFIFLGVPKSGKFKAAARIVRKHSRKDRRSALLFRFDSFSADGQRGLVISSSSSVGLLQGVYELLERWGVHWYLPGEKGTAFEEKTSIDLPPTHEGFAPTFKYRGLWFDAGRSDSPDSELIQWWGRNRLNLFRGPGQDVPLLRLFGFQTNTGDREILSNLLTRNRLYRYNHPVFVPDQHYPTDPYLLSEKYPGDIDNDGQLSYAEAHPEWFETSFPNAGQNDTKKAISFCPANPEAAREFARLVLAELVEGAWRECDIIDLWEPEVWCDCAGCRKQGNPANRLLLLAQTLSEQIQRAKDEGRLNRCIKIFAYCRLRGNQPPTISLNSDENIIVFLDAWPRCYNHHIISTECVNVNLWFIKEVFGWLEKKTPYQGRLGIMEHYADENYAGLAALHSQVMKIDLPAFAELGFSAVQFLHPSLKKDGSAAFQCFLYAQKSWNREAMLDSLKMQYIRFAYGPWAETAAKYHDAMEKCLSTITTWMYYLPRRAPNLLNPIKKRATDRPTLFTESFDRQQHRDEPNFNNLWEDTYNLVFECFYILQPAMEQFPSSVYDERMQTLIAEQQHASLIISTFDNLITFITAEDEFPEDKIEAVYRLRENKQKLAEYKFFSPFNGATTALVELGIKELIDEVLRIEMN